MLKYLLALCLSMILMGTLSVRADSVVTIKINKRAPYTVTLFRAGKSIGSNTGEGSQRVRIRADSADKVCVKFSGGYMMKTPDGRLLTVSCHPMMGRSHIWGHKNIIKQ